VTVFPTPGTYTIPGTTITVSSSTVVPEATSTVLPSGTHTIGGVTTVVETSTTVVCPYATVSPVGSTFTSVIETTTYVCPSAGTYTIAPITTTVPASTVVVYPTPATVTPGTYTQPEQTVTVVETSYTYVCPFATSSTPAPAPAAATTTAAPAPAPVSSTSTSTSAPAPSSTSTSSGGSGLGQHDNYAVTYTGYTHDTGACMSADEVLTELKNIQANGFYAIRMYSTDCNQLETVASQAIGLGLKVILGVYIDASGVSSGSSQVSDIVSWGQSNGWSGVEFISLDNEALSDGFCSASDLAGFVSSAKATIKGAGYSGQFTLTEPLNIWQSSGSTLCGVVDFASANLQAFFNGDVAAEDAGTFVASEVEILKGICNNDQVFVGECGWPTAGDSNGKAIPGVSEQKAAMDAIRSSIGSIAAQFSYKNDHWKSPGSLNVEQYWGISEILSSAE
jgi:exo-beta-1,3-glucanase (GH17 family)